MSSELTIFNDAVKPQMPMLVKATGLNQQELQSKLISFAYETKKMLEAAKSSIANLDPQSIREAFKDSLDTGIPIDGRKLAYPIKYGNQLQYHIGYKGFIAKMKEVIPSAQIKAEIVYAGDVLTIEKVDGKARYTHKVADPFSPISKMTGVYAYLQYVDKGKEYSFIETMSKDEVIKIQGKAKTKNVWNDWFSEMAKKAVIRRLLKTLSIGNPKIQILEEIDNKEFDFQQEPTHIDYDQAQPMPEEVQPNKAEVVEAQDKIVEPEVMNDTESAFDNMYRIEKVEKKEGLTKSGRPYVLSTLHLEGGVVVKTFDKQDYMEGMTVELEEWDKEKGQCKRAKIL